MQAHTPVNAVNLHSVAVASGPLQLLHGACPSSVLARMRWMRRDCRLPRHTRARSCLPGICVRRFGRYLKETHHTLWPLSVLSAHQRREAQGSRDAVFACGQAADKRAQSQVHFQDHWYI